MKRMSEEDASRCFELRCKSKRGEKLSRADQKFLDKMFRYFPTHYAEMNDAIFQATKPFGALITTS